MLGAQTPPHAVCKLYHSRASAVAGCSGECSGPTLAVRSTAARHEEARLGQDRLRVLCGRGRCYLPRSVLSSVDLTSAHAAYASLTLVRSMAARQDAQHQFHPPVIHLTIAACITPFALQQYHQTREHHTVHRAKHQGTSLACSTLQIGCPIPTCSGAGQSTDKAIRKPLSLDC